MGAVLALSANPAELLVTTLEGDLRTLPQRLLEAVLALSEDPGQGAPLRAALGAAVLEPPVAALLKESMENEMIDKVAARIGGVDARKRAVAVFSQVLGLVFTRFVLCLEPVTSMPRDEILRVFVPPLQAVLMDRTRLSPQGTVRC